MANWKVSAERVEISVHPNADAMEIAKVGMFQLVVAKSSGHKSGDLVVFAPKRAVLPEELRSHYFNSETGLSYLKGPNNDRVSSIRLRGELSEGVLVPLDYVLNKLGLEGEAQLVIGEDLAGRLGISLFEPPLPVGFGGELKAMQIAGYVTHDVEQMAIYAGELQAGEPVVVTEKVHGSQCALLIGEDGTAHVSSKGFFAKGIEILEDGKNLYWRALRNTQAIELLRAAFPGAQVQAFGEAIPAQGANWSYGATGNKPALRLFRLVVNGRELPISEAKAVSGIGELWVPILYEGPFDLAALRLLAKGKEQVSGKQLHKREGGVVTPLVPRAAKEGFNLALKLVSPDFKDSDDAVS